MNAFFSTGSDENQTTKQYLFLAITVAACLLGYLLGYIVSSKTGVEPGFFEQAETGGYGVVAEKPVIKNIDSDIQQHYEQLIEE